MEEIFRALGDASRRELLDRLYERDGQTLNELCDGLAMTRFGVMKHLDILELAGLITTRRSGREKFHYLNPVPIRLIHDRWISKYAEPWAGALAGLKRQLEDTMEKPKQVHEVYIRTTPEELWRAITDPDMTEKYFYGTRIMSSFTPGSPMVMTAGGGNSIDGEILEVDRPRRLLTTFRALYDPEVAGEGHSKVLWEIEPMGAMCRLRLTHYDLGPKTFGSVDDGWKLILSSLKSLLETGTALEMAGA